MIDEPGRARGIHPFAGKTRREIVSMVLFPLFIASVILIAFVFRKSIAGLLGSRETFRSWLLARGEWGIPGFILIQFIQVVIFVIPGEVVQIAGGFVFGTFQGMLWSAVGIAAGSIFNFYIARVLGKPFIESIAGKGRIEKFNVLITSIRGESAFFLFFLIPGIPKDILCYVAGLSRLGFWAFFVISSLGRLPGIAASALMGDAAGEGRWVFFIVVGTLSLALLVIGIMFRERLHALIERLSKLKKKKDNDYEDRID
jgi:uncharacterized membrane protein YdjX (TVP38/TMEM64 family)